MFSLNAGALIIASVGFVSVESTTTINQLTCDVSSFRGYDAIGYLITFVILNVMVCSIFLRTRPLTKLPGHVGCMFRPKSTNTNTKPCLVFSVIKVREYAQPQTRFYQECYARLSMARLEIPRPIWRHRIHCPIVFHLTPEVLGVQIHRPIKWFTLPALIFPRVLGLGSESSEAIPVGCFVTIWSGACGVVLLISVLEIFLTRATLMPQACGQHREMYACINSTAC